MTHDKNDRMIVCVFLEDQFQQVTSEHGTFKLYFFTINPRLAAYSLMLLLKLDPVGFTASSGPLPTACDLGRDNPLENIDTVTVDTLVRHPITHVESMGNNTGAWTQLIEQSGAQLHVDDVEQVKSDDGRFTEFRIEQVTFIKVDQMLNTRVTGVLLSFSDSLWIHVNTDTTRMPLQSSRNNDAPVPAS